LSARAAARLAWSIVGFAVAFEGLFVLFLILNSSDPRVDTYDYWLADMIIATVFPAVGALIASRYPANVLGWLFCVAGLFVALGGLAGEYAVYALVVEPGSLTGGAWAAWAGSFVSEIGFFPLVVLVPLLFPDGRPPSRRWWSVAWLVAVAGVAMVVSRAFWPGPLEDFPRVENPLGVEGAETALGLLSWLVEPVLFPCLLASILSLILRFRRSRGEERQQLKWFTLATVLIPFSFLGNTLLPDLAWLIGGASVAAMPAAIGVAVLKHRLYDVDLLINRTLVYGALTASLAIVYVGSVVGLQYAFRAITGEDSQLVIVASTLVIAALFSPLRRRIQGAVDRRFYRRKYDAGRTLEAFSVKLRSETDLDDLASELLAVARETVQPEHVRLWLRSAAGPGRETGRGA
jgi:hypothetical protein